MKKRSDFMRVMDLLPNSFLVRPGAFLLVFAVLWIFRTLYGLSRGFWGRDEIQTYLIGLKWFATGQWPYFGPDLIVDETGCYKQIPGALETLLIGAPGHLLPISEKPWLILNFISLSGIAFFSWCGALRMPNLSFGFICWAKEGPRAFIERMAFD